MTKPNSVDAASLHPIVPRPLADEVADKAKRVFQFMVSQDGNKAFGSVLGTNILITIERVDRIRPAWWPADFEWPPSLGEAEAMRAVAEGIPCTPEDVAAEELRQQREGTFELPESLRDASKVLERIKRCQHNVKQGLDGEAVCIKCNEDLGWYCPASREHVCEYTDVAMFVWWLHHAKHDAVCRTVDDGAYCHARIV